jgi:hypothetical protein
LGASIDAGMKMPAKNATVRPTVDRAARPSGAALADGQ